MMLSVLSLLAGVTATLSLMFGTASADCLVGDIMYLEGDSIGYLGLECLNSTSFDATESVCGPDGVVVETDAVLACPTISEYCVQCGAREPGAALCLSTPDLPSDCVGVVAGDDEEEEEEDPLLCEVGTAADPAKACADGEFCQLEEGICNSKMAFWAGSCNTIPEVCTYEYVPVCGCDEIDYANNCEAYAAGVSVSRTGECSSNPVTGFFDDVNVTSVADPVTDFFENTTDLLGNLTGIGDNATEDDATKESTILSGDVASSALSQAATFVAVIVSFVVWKW